MSEESDFNPSIGGTTQTRRICFIDDSGAKQMIFFHLPVFILMVLNVVGFIFTLLLVHQAKRRTRSSRSQETSRGCEVNRSNARADQESKEQIVGRH